MDLSVDVVIFGGGVAGLWFLDEITRQNRSAVLLESQALGNGQTVASQGIIHGGLKYSLQGILTRSTERIREMPNIWRECLAGTRHPNLSSTPVRSDFCYLWRTDSVTSRLGMLGAKLGLQTATEALSAEERPDVLKHCPGSVAKLPEQVICSEGMITSLAEPHWDRILKITPEETQWKLSTDGNVEELTVRADEEQSLTLRPMWVVFAAGSGNAMLRSQVGLSTETMQRRPLHMAMVRGSLPVLNGHCVDGAKTRVTVTSAHDNSGRVVWQVGGQVAEVGVDFEPARLIAHAKHEVLACVPGLDLSGTEWSTYRVDRAEARTETGTRPDTAQILRDQNILTAWPTKLALAPRLAEKLTAVIQGSLAASTKEVRSIRPRNWPKPPVAVPPWNQSHVTWMTDSGEPIKRSAA